MRICSRNTRKAASVVSNHYVSAFYKVQILADNLLEGSPELIEIGHLFRKLGQSDLAVSAFKKAGRGDLACDCAIELNDWSQG